MREFADVVVVGAGPVGATAALLLAARGVSTVLVERRTSPLTHPAAHVATTRSMEIWRELGLEPAIRTQCAAQEDLQAIVYCTTLAGFEIGRIGLSVDLDDRLPAIDEFSPTQAAHVPQNSLVPLLWKHLALCPQVEFESGCTVVECHQDVDGVDVSLATESGATQTIRARYLIGADGASSTVRRQSGVSMRGPLLQHMVSVHFAADLDELRAGRRGPVIWTHTPKGIGTIIVHRSPEDLIFQMPYYPPLESMSDFPETVCKAAILDAIGSATVDVTVKSVQPWAMTAQIADTYRLGRVFLAGDAAHRFPPTGGLGMNTGVADAHNLAWKLAWVLDGRAGEALLDTYDAERRPVGVRASAYSVTNYGGMFDVLSALGVPARAARALPRIAEATPPWVPRRPARAVLRASSALAHQRLRLAALSGRVGRRVRRRTAAVVADQAAHYRSWGRDLGVRYLRGAILSDREDELTDGGEFYRATLHAGARIPHCWVATDTGRVSTLDLVDVQRLTLLVSDSTADAWATSTAHRIDIVVRSVPDEAALWRCGESDTPIDAILVRPDGHIVAPLRAGDAALLDRACAAVHATRRQPV